MTTSTAARPQDLDGAAPKTRKAARPLRIAFLSYRSDPKVGGQGIFLSLVAAALARRGHQVEILSGPPYPVVPPGVKLTEVPSLDLYAQPFKGRLALRWRHLTDPTALMEFFGHHSGKFMEPQTFGRRVAKLLKGRRGDFDVVLDNQCLAYGLLEVEAAGLPVVGIIHHPIHRDLELAVKAERRWWMRALVRRWYSFLPMQETVASRLRKVLVVSKASGQDVADRLGADPNAITVVPLGIDQTIFRPGPESERRPNRLLSTASADAPLKGVRFLLEAYADLLKTRPDLQLVLVGRLREGGDTAQLLERLKLKDKVRFVHDLSTETLAAFYGSATIAVTPSLYEGFGLPAAEAMACGTPVVVTDGGALPEVVGEAGVVVPRADSAALANALAALLDDPEHRARMSKAGLERVTANFSWDRLAERYEAVLADAVEAGRAKGAEAAQC